MKIEPVLSIPSQPANPNGPPTAQSRIVLFGDFLPDTSEESLAACALVSAGLAVGQSITTVTCAKDAFAQVTLCTKTPMNFQRALMQLSKLYLEQAERVIVVLNCFVQADLQSTTRFRRLKERRRNMLILSEILRQRPDVTVIGDGTQARLFLRAAQMLARTSAPGLSSLDLRPSDALLHGSLAKELGLDLSASKSVNALLMMKHHVASGQNAPRLDAQRILKTDALRDHGDELKFLARIAARPVLKTHPLVRRLRNARALQQPTEFCKPPHRLLDAAQSLSPEGQEFGLPLSRYMMFFHRMLNLADEFPLTTRQQAETYVRWYKRRGFERAPAKWLPDPPATPKGVSSTANPARPPKDTKADRVCHAVLDLLDTPDGTLAPDDETTNFLSSNPQGVGPSRFAVLMAILCQIPCRIDPRKSLWTSEEIGTWFDTTVCGVTPGYRRFSQLQPESKPQPPRLEVFGMPNSTTGLGANTHMAEIVLDRLNLPYTLHDTEAPERTAQASVPRGGRRRLKRNVVLHKVNADRIPFFMMSPQLAHRNDPYHIGFLLWELNRIPEAHRLGIDMLDEIWAPSRFVADLYSSEADKPVHLIKKGLVQLETLKELSLQQTQPSGRFTVLVCFDFHSSVERKNPLAAVLGFLTAFPKVAYGDCRLIVKTTPTTPHHWGDPNGQMDQIRSLARTDDRIRLVESLLPEPALWQMMQDADCILSTHRAEGFGYIPAFALALGKPLVTTDHSGPVDFCTAQTSFPVAAELVDVPKGHTLYFQPGATWADVAPETVAEQLRQVYSDIDAAKRRGRFGQDYISREYSVAAHAARCEQRLSDIGIL